MGVVGCHIVVSDEPTVLLLFLIERHRSVNTTETERDRAISNGDVEFAFEQIIVRDRLVIEPVKELKHLSRDELSAEIFRVLVLTLIGVFH